MPVLPQPSEANKIVAGSLTLISLLSSATMVSREAETYLPEAHVIELAEVRQIVFEMQKRSESGGTPMQQ